MKEIRIYFEGDTALRKGFHNFFAEIRKRAIKGFQLVACDGTPEKDFAIALKQHPDAWNILLRDSEGKELPSTRSENRFWMIELMEAWFLADPEALENYYRHGFRISALKKNPDVEKISKADVRSCLAKATKETQTGRYHKTKHAPDILARINPQKVRQRARECERLFVTVLAKIDS